MRTIEGGPVYLNLVVAGSGFLPWLPELRASQSIVCVCYPGVS